MRSLLEEIVCSGSPYEMGVTQGNSIKGRTDAMFRVLLDNRYVPGWLRLSGTPVLKALLLAAGLRVRLRHSANMRRYSGSAFERMRGIADGAGVGLTLMLGMSAIETISASLHFVLGCTSVGVGRKRSKTGRPFLAYNHDFPGFLRNQILVRRSRPKKGYRSVQLTYPPMPGAICGVNAKGLALTLNHAFSVEPPNDGIPPTFLVQEALDRCGDADEALKIFRRTRFSCGSIVTVVDKKGRIYALELARGRFGVRRPVRDLSLTLNAYQLDELRAIEVPQEATFHPEKYPDFFHGLPIHFPNWGRRRRFSALLRHHRRLGPSDLRRFLSDHEGTAKGGLGTICCHHPTSDTIATALLYPGEGVLEAARGHACRAEYQRFSV